MLKTEVWKDVVLKRAGEKPWEFLTGLMTEMQADTYCPGHSHIGIEIVFHRLGEGETKVATESISFGEGSVVIYGPGQLHDQSSRTAIADCCVHVKAPAAAGRRLREALFLPALPDARLGEELRQLAAMPSVRDEIAQRILNFRATALLMDLVRAADAFQEETTVDSSELRVRRAEAFIRENYARIDSMSQVADHAGVSHDYLRHVFKTCRGRSIVQYLTEVKIAQAKSLLAHSTLPLKQVAASCGFKDEYYFSAVFRKNMRVAPGAYRGRLIAGQGSVSGRSKATK